MTRVHTPQSTSTASELEIDTVGVAWRGFRGQNGKFGGL